MKRLRVAVIVGTRPEAIKLAPVIQRLQKSPVIQPVIVATSQHRDMVEPVLDAFGLRVDHDLRVMRRAQKLWDLSGRLAQRLGDYFERHPAVAVLVQGDTSSAFFGGLSAYYHKIPVGHVEAGLRTGDRYAPFPEEMNRALLSRLATWHFAPTRDAARRLRHEGIDPRAIHLTGNTIVDALRWMTAQPTRRRKAKLPWPLGRGRKLVLVTCHRRESFGAPVADVAEAIARLANRNPDVRFLFPVHPNPAVKRAVRARLAKLDNVILTAPLEYDVFLAALSEAAVVLSDSGGVQEEATALGKPVLILRDKTERPEGIRAGTLKLVGTDASKIERECQRLLAKQLPERMSRRASKTFGDGRAAPRIVRVLEKAVA